MDSNLLLGAINRFATYTSFNVYLRGTRFENDPHRRRRYCKWKDRR